MIQFDTAKLIKRMADEDPGCHESLTFGNRTAGRAISMKYLQVLITGLLICCSTTGKAQLSFFKSGWPADTMKQAVEQLYNYQFSKASLTIQPLRKIEPEHSAIQIFDCLMIFWKNFPVSAHPKEYELYKASLMKALDHTRDILEKKKEDPEHSFYALLLDILIARHMYEDGEKWKAVQYASDAFTYIKKGFTLQEKYSEYYLTSGLYKFYREFFANMNPVYKPLMSVFPSGNIKEGLLLLDKATTSTVFVRGEAFMYCSYIHLRYQNDKKEGLRFATSMNNLYPENYFFKVLYIENLIQSGEYEKGRVELNKLMTSKISYFKLPSYLFRAMLEERYAHDINEAIIWYEAAIKSTPEISKANTNFVGMAHYYLAGIYLQKGNKSKAKQHYKLAEDYCEYVTLKRDAQKKKQAL